MKFYKPTNTIPLRHQILIFLLLICGSTIHAQRTCGNELNSLKEAHLHPNQVKKDMKAFKEWQKQRAVENRSSIPVTIPVHVIVVHGISENVGQGSNVDMEHINSQLQVLNDDFARTNDDASNTPSVFDAAATEISFCLATIDPMGNPTEGVTRYPTGSDFQDIEDTIIENTIWPPTRYLNIYLAPDLNGLLGYSSRPTPGNLPSTNNDVIRVLTGAFGGEGFATDQTYNLGRTATHEIGHWLGLRHVWGNGGCSSDDGFDDTPSQDEPNYSCPSHPSVSCSNGGDMFMNYMDYVDDDCMNSFSQEQADYMSFIIEGTRTQLINSATTACVPSGFPILNIASIQDVICPGEQTGSVEINSTSGTPPYTFSLNNGPSQADGIFQNLAAGDYNVAVTESEGRTSEISFTIGEPDPLQFTNTILSETCNGQSAGSIQVETTGGNSNFPELHLFGGSYSVIQKSVQQEDFESGFPVDWVADTNWEFGDAGSLSSFSFPFPTTSQFMGFNDDALGENHVGGGSIYSSDINLEGATSFKIIFDAFFINGDYEGDNETAKLYLSQNNGASWEEYLDLPGEESSWLRYTLEISDWSSSTVKIRFAYDDGGGWNYGLGIDNIIVQDINYGDFTNLPAGNFTIRATDANGCNYEESITINSSEPVSITNLEITAANCSTPGELSATATSVNGISEYQLNGISSVTGTFQNLLAGQYEIIAVDNLGCSTSQTIQVMDLGQVMLNLNVTADVQCANGNDGSFEIGIVGASGDIMVSLDGSNIGSTSNASYTATDLSAGDYTVSIEDSNGCTAELVVTVGEIPALTFTGEVTDVSCSGPGSISQSATGGTAPYTYSILGAVQTAFFDNLSPGIYVVTTMDTNGCVVENTLEVQDLSTGFDITESVANCSNDTELEYLVEFCSSTGAEADWIIYNDQGVEIINAGTGACVTVDFSSYLEAAQNDFFYGVEASVGNQCLEEFNGVAYYPAELVLLADLPIKICEGSMYSLDPSNNTEFSEIIITDENGSIIEPNSIGIYPISSGNYNISYIDMNGCTGSQEILISEVANPMLAIDFQTDATSSTGGSIQLSSDAENLTYFLDGESNSTGFFSELEAGDYTINAITEEGCETELEFTILLESSIEDIELSKNLHLYPNPTDNVLFVELVNGQNIDQLSIYHADGRLILTENNLDRLKEVNTRSFQTGLYFVSVRSEGKIAYKRFINL